MLDDLKRAIRLAITGPDRRRFQPGDLPARRVMMFHPARSGSTVVAEMLNQHPEVSWQGEVIYHLYHRLPFKRLRIPPARLLLDCMVGVEKPIVGFEAQYYQIGLHLRSSLYQFVTALERLDFQHFIVLSRRNHLRSVVSNLVAMERGRWSYRPDERVPRTRIRVNVDRIYSYPGTTLRTVLEAHDRNRQRVKELLPGYLDLVYEDSIQSDPRVAYRTVCDYLGIESVGVTITTRRTTPHPLAEVIDNYDEVSAELKGTRFEWMLEG